jgi:preprotein translocase subunit SecG
MMSRSAILLTAILAVLFVAICIGVAYLQPLSGT